MGFIVLVVVLGMLLSVPFVSKKWTQKWTIIVMFSLSISFMFIAANVFGQEEQATRWERYETRPHRRTSVSFGDYDYSVIFKFKDNPKNEVTTMLIFVYRNGELGDVIETNIKPKDFSVNDYFLDENGITVK